MLLLAVSACMATPAPLPSPAPTLTPAPTAEHIGAAERPIVLLLAPSADPARARSLGDALVATLASASGLRWRASLPTNYSEALEDLCGGAADVAFVDQLAYLVVSERNCGEAQLMLARPDDAGLQSATFRRQVVARADSGIGDATGLRGRVVAFGDPADSPGALEAIRAITAGAGPTAFFSRALYPGSHSAALLALQRGDVDAAAIAVAVRDAAGNPVDTARGTRRLMTIEQIPNEAVVLRRGIPLAIVDRIRQSLLDAAKSEAGLRLLRELHAAEGLLTADVKLYEPLRLALRAVGVDLTRHLTRTAAPTAR